jgi:hypothetical protein
MVDTAGSLGAQGVLQVIPPAELERQIAAREAEAANANMAPPQNPSQLAGYIKGRFEIFRNHRNTTNGWSERLLASFRTFNGVYDATQIQEISKFGGSNIYARIAAQKCRAASSLLRDIYLSQDRPYAVRGPADPDIPQEVLDSIDQLVQAEEQQVTQTLGKPPPARDLQERKDALLESAGDAAKRKATKQARTSEDRIEEVLRSGGFYHALAEFLVDLPIFPFAIMKGPVVKVVPEVEWPKGGGPPDVKMTPKLTWNRVSPFDIWFTPGVADIENAEVIEKLSVTRGELNDLLDLPGYDQEEIRAVLDEYGRGGLYDNWDTTDAERAVMESRENPAWNRSGMLSLMEYNGNVQGRMLQEYGLAVPDELRDYSVQVWCIGTHVIKCHLSPSPRKRHPYFMTSFEKVPGTPVGNSLIDLLQDLQQAANATLRALVNNMSIASGPQVMINDDRITPDDDNQLYPWKRWHARNDPVGSNNQPPISFFMPTMNAESLMKCYREFVEIADDVSAIPKYVGGQGDSSGAGRTASGLAMLMGNASKILQTVSANIDREVIEPALMQLSDLILLTDTTGLLTGEEDINVLGVNVAIQRETIRQRQLEFLQTTLNPTDMKIMGISGRGAVLRSIATTIGLNGEEVVPNEEKLEAMEKQEQKQREHGPVMEQIEQGVQKGVGQGVQQITKELTALGIGPEVGLNQMQAGPEGAPGEGPPPGNGPMRNPRDGGVVPASGGKGPFGAQPQGSRPGGNRGGNVAQMAAYGQGTRRGPPTGGMAPQTALTGNQPGPPGPGGPPRLSPGVG